MVTHLMDCTLSPATMAPAEAGFKCVSAWDGKEAASGFEAALSQHPRLKMLQAEKADLTGMKKAARKLWGVRGGWYLG